MAAAAMLVLSGCADGADARAVRDTAASAGGPATVAALPSVANVAATAIRFTVAPTGNTARYRVREQLLGRDRENDAIGETTQITGSIVVDRSGALVPGQSRFVVRTAEFKSDSDRRDGYVRGRLLEADQFPTVELVPTAVRRLPARLPAAGGSAGPIAFELIGDLTVRGVTRPTTQGSAAQG